MALEMSRGVSMKLLNLPYTYPYTYTYLKSYFYVKNHSLWLKCMCVCVFIKL